MKKTLLLLPALSVLSVLYSQQAFAGAASISFDRYRVLLDQNTQTVELTLKNTESKKSEESEFPDETEIEEIPMTQIVAWYSPQIPVSQGPLEYWGLPGLILEVSVGNTTMLCSKVILNPKEKSKLSAPDKGEEVTKKEYQTIIMEKMREFRDNRGRRRRS